MNAEPKCPYPIVEIKSTRTYKAGYIVRKEVINCDYPKIHLSEMINSYDSVTGAWLGSAKDAHFLCKKMCLSNFQSAYEDSEVISLAFCEKDQKWYGWSHRAMQGFGIGDDLFHKDELDNDKTPFTKCGGRTITTLDQAKEAAINFANYVS